MVRIQRKQNYGSARFDGSIMICASGRLDGPICRFWGRCFTGRMCGRRCLCDRDVQLAGIVRVQCALTFLISASPIWQMRMSCFEIYRRYSFL